MRRKSSRRALLGVLAVYLLLALVKISAVPFGEGEDENAHFERVRFHRDTHRLPRIDPAEVGQAHHPPLYYALAAALVAPLPDPGETLIPNPFWGYRMYKVGADNRNMYLHLAWEQRGWTGTALIWLALQGGSVAMGAATVLLTYFTGRLIFNGDERFALGMAAVTALTPGYQYHTATVSNDHLAMLLGAAALYLMARTVRDGPRWRVTAALGVLLGLGIITKYLVLPIVVAAPLAYLLAKKRPRWQRVLAHLLLVGALVALVSGWWFLHNLNVYGDVTGLRAISRSIRPPTPPSLNVYPYLSVMWFGSFWFGLRLVRVPEILWTLWGAASVALLAAGGAGLVRRARPGGNRRLAALLGAVVAVTLVQQATTVVNSLHGGQGRFMYPALPAIMGLMAWALWTWLPLRARGWALGGTLALMMVVTFSVWVRYLIPAFAPPALTHTAAGLSYTTPVNALFDGRARLLGYSLSTDRLTPGDDLRVELCWLVEGRFERNAVLFVQLVGPDNTKAGQRDTHPGGGNYPTTLWEPGAAFCDSVVLPVDATATNPAAYTLALGLYDEERGRLPVILSSGETTDVVTPTRVGVAAPDPALADVLGRATVFAAGAEHMALLDCTLDISETGVTAQLSWTTDHALARDYVMFLHVVSADGKVVSQGDAEPMGGSYPTSLWTPLARVDDRLTADLPAAPGHYTIWLGVYDRGTGTRMILPDGTDALLLNTFEVD